MSVKKLFFFSFLLLLAIVHPGFAQENATVLFKEVVLKADTSSYTLSRNAITFGGEKQLAFPYSRENQVAEIQIFPAVGIQRLKIAPSADFTLLDSIVNVNNEYFKFRVRFKALTTSQFLNFTFFATPAGSSETRTEIIKLFPYTQTTVKFLQEESELFIGEEKISELSTNNLANIRFSTDWVKGEGLEYRLSEKNNILRLHIMPTALGKRTLKLNLQTVRPSLNANGKTTYDLPVIEQTFSVKGSRLRFLATDKKEVTYDDLARTKGIEILIDNNWNLNLQKTYRIEDQEQPGGMLVAELFTRNNVTNNKVLCWLRLFNYHRISEGYLYIKDGDQARFITNFDVIPKTSIKSVAIMHEGGDWTTNLTVNPGEVISLKIEGEGLQKAQFNFEDLRDITADSTLLSESAAVFRLRVPINIARKRIGIYNRTTSTGYALTVKEHQRPKPLDFVLLNYGDKPRKITTIASGPVFYEHVLKDVVLSFSPNLIDQDRKLYGRQHLNIQIRVTNNRNELIDQRTIENIVICPGENSPRAAFYGEACTHGEISLNNYLGRKTYDLNEWSKVEIVVSHDKDKYGGEGFSKKVEIVLRRRVKFDTEVSFPAGLLVKNQGTDGYGSFGGISMAMIAQFSFYHPEKINRYRPYKIGAGFLALNAFNFSNSANVQRDLGVVVIGSLYPTTRDTKLSFPLYLGGGYFISKSKNPWFYFLGPGIQVRF